MLAVGDTPEESYRYWSFCFCSRACLYLVFRFAIITINFTELDIYSWLHRVNVLILGCEFAHIANNKV